MPPKEPNWETASIEAQIDVAHELGARGDGITPAIARGVAEPLRSVGRSQLIDLPSRIRSAWPITDDELECVGFFLERRAIPAADRFLHATEDCYEVGV